MKVSLVVATGAHQGKVIPITGPQFLIGRDTQCHLRPASQAISKHHCGVLVRDGQIYIKDFGSTNGTLVNDVLIRATEVLVIDGASLKLGPLDFIVRIEVPTPKPDGTPLPSDSPETAAALAAVKAATGAAAGSKVIPVRDATPNPSLAKKPGKPGVSGGSKEMAPLSDSKEAAALKAAAAKAAAPKSTEAKPAPTPAPAVESATQGTSLVNDADDDKMAAMLLGMEDEGVPDGSTVIDAPAIDAQGQPITPGSAKPDDKNAKKPAVAQSREEMSSAASDLLRKMMRRPK